MKVKLDEKAIKTIKEIVLKTKRLGLNKIWVIPYYNLFREKRSHFGDKGEEVDIDFGGYNLHLTLNISDDVKETFDIDNIDFEYYDCKTINLKNFDLNKITKIIEKFLQYGIPRVRLFVDTRCESGYMSWGNEWDYDNILMEPHITLSIDSDSPTPNILDDTEWNYFDFTTKPFKLKYTLDAKEKLVRRRKITRKESIDF